MTPILSQLGDAFFVCILMPMLVGLPLLAFLHGCATRRRDFVRSALRVIAIYYLVVMVSLVVFGLLTRNEPNGAAWVIVFLVALCGPVVAVAIGDMKRGGPARPEHEEAPTCAACGYSLIGNTSGRCPECGNEIPQHQQYMIARFAVPKSQEAVRTEIEEFGFCVRVPPVMTEADLLGAMVKVHVELRDGSCLVGTFYTLGSIQARMEESRKTGELAGGQYMWDPYMIIVRDLRVDTLRSAIADLLARDELNGALCRADALDLP